RGRAGAGSLRLTPCDGALRIRPGRRREEMRECSAHARPLTILLVPVARARPMQRALLVCVWDVMQQRRRDVVAAMARCRNEPDHVPVYLSNLRGLLRVTPRRSHW